MILTNRLGLPSPIVNAVANDPYDRGNAHISVTALIGPARKRALEQRYHNQITEDVADRIFSLFGQVAHGILERADHEAWTEERLYIERHKWTISGKFDRVILEHGTLQDYKVTSTYSISDGVKPEFVAQLNLYAHMLRAYGQTVTRLQTVNILRDWQRAKARHTRSYPQHPVIVLDAPMWEPQQVEDYITDRLAEHGRAQYELPDCTAEERWEQPASWAVMKVGGQRATSRHETRDEAERAMTGLLERAKKGVEYELIEIPAVQKRCADYCVAAAFCEQWQRLKPPETPTGGAISKALGLSRACADANGDM